MTVGALSGFRRVRRKKLLNVSPTIGCWAHSRIVRLQKKEGVCAISHCFGSWGLTATALSIVGRSMSASMLVALADAAAGHVPKNGIAEQGGLAEARPSEGAIMVSPLSREGRATPII